MITRPCDTCRADVLWANRIADHKPVPLDPEPVAGGEYVIVAETFPGTSVERAYARAAKKDEHADRLRYRRHSCKPPEKP